MTDQESNGQKLAQLRADTIAALPYMSDGLLAAAFQLAAFQLTNKGALRYPDNADTLIYNAAGASLELLSEEVARRMDKALKLSRYPDDLIPARGS